VSEDGRTGTDVRGRDSGLLGAETEDVHGTAPTSHNGHAAHSLIFSEDMDEPTETTRGYLPIFLACGYAVIAAACVHQAYKLIRDYYGGGK
jgi:hypothetical protein